MKSHPTPSLPADGTPSAFSRKPRFREGFTLIEMLVVLAIIGILAGILFPVHSSLRYRAWAARTQDTTLQVAQAWTLYIQEHRRFPPEVATLPHAEVDGDGDTSFPMTPQAAALLAEHFERSELQRQHGIVSVWVERQLRRSGGSAALQPNQYIRVKLDTGYSGKIQLNVNGPEEVRKTAVAWSHGETASHPIIRSW